VKETYIQKKILTKNVYSIEISFITFLILNLKIYLIKSFAMCTKKKKVCDEHFFPNISNHTLLFSVTYATFFFSNVIYVTIIL